MVCHVPACPHWLPPPSPHGVSGAGSGCRRGRPPHQLGSGTSGSLRLGRSSASSVQPLRARRSIRSAASFPFGNYPERAPPRENGAARSSSLGEGARARRRPRRSRRQAGAPACSMRWGMHADLAEPRAAPPPAGRAALRVSLSTRFTARHPALASTAATHQPRNTTAGTRSVQVRGVGGTWSRSWRESSM